MLHISPLVKDTYSGNLSIANIPKYSSYYMALKKHNETVCQLFVDLKKVYESARRDVLYNIPIEFGTPMKVLRLIKMYF
jgi:hypothetical protein